MIPPWVSNKVSATSALHACHQPTEMPFDLSNWARFVGRLGLSTCYDMRFPELYMELVKRGAQILLMPSAFTVPTGMAHWHTLLQGMCEDRC